MDGLFEEDLVCVQCRTES